MLPVVRTWQSLLGGLLNFYENRRGSIFIFFPLLFSFFMVLNAIFYWVAMFQIYPHLLTPYYIKVQFPASFLGALFDTFSFFITIFILKRAVNTQRNGVYIFHISIDLVIAVLASIWVVYAFSIAGWAVRQFDPFPQILAMRNARYERMVIEAVNNPSANLDNIYFGAIMGISSMIPTCLHLMMLLLAVPITFFKFIFKISGIHRIL